MNSITIVGRIARDPEQRAAGQSMVTSFSIAERTWKKDAQGQNIANFWDVEAWGKTGETIMRNCHKGDQIILSGRIDKQKWIDKTTGQPREKTIINANEMEFGAKPQGQGQPAPAPQRQPAPRPGQNPPGYGPRPGAQQRPAPRQPAPQYQEPSPEQWDEPTQFEMGSEDNVPF